MTPQVPAPAAPGVGVGVGVLAVTNFAGEDGFGIIELLVALSIIFIGVVALTYTTSVALVDTAYARQRQAANGLAGKAMEQLRAIPFSTLAAGLSTSDPTLAGDPAVTGCTVGGTTYSYCYDGEPMPTTSSASVGPIDPHIHSVVIGPTTYKVAVYVTYNSTGSSGPGSSTAAYDAYVVVSWTGAARQGVAPSVTTTSVFYSPVGCSGSVTHPLSGPCIPYLYGTADATGGQVSVSGSVSGAPFTSLSLSSAGGMTTMQLEQASSTQAVSSTSGASLSQSTLPAQAAGSYQASAITSEDPASSSPAYECASFPTSCPSSSAPSQVPQAATTLTSSGGSGTNGISVTSSASDTALGQSTTSASTTNACANPKTGSPAQTQQPCGYTDATQAGTASATMALYAGTTSLGSANLAVLGPSPAPASPVPGPVQSFVARYMSPGSNYCTGAAGSGCVHAGVSLLLGQLDLGGLPSGVAVPAGWSSGGTAPCGAYGYLVELCGYGASAAAEAGQGAAISGTSPSAPTSASASGRISYWDGTGFTTASLSGRVAGSSIPAKAVVVRQAVSGGRVSVQVTPYLTAGGAATTSSSTVGGSSSCSTCMAAASSDVPAPIGGYISYVVSYAPTGGTASQVASVDITPSIGGVQAKASYAPAG
ncbi:MAG: type IV pilus modification PilV family protein [Acidimicrobiales bacterium]